MFRKLRLLRLSLKTRFAKDPMWELPIIQPHFDQNFYVGSNPDVALAGYSAPLHFINHGWRERRDPSPDFSTRAYLRDNPDVARAQVNPFLHYLLYGALEGRRRTPVDAVRVDARGSFGAGAHESEIHAYFRGRMKRASLPEPVLKHPLALLAFTNRSGSNLLVDYLSQTGKFSGFKELLNSEEVISASKREGIEYFSDYFINIQKNDMNDGNCIYGFKSSASQIVMLQRWRMLSINNGVFIVHLKRRDIISQAVSMSIAEQTGSWTSAHEVESEPVYRFRQIRDHIYGFKNANDTIDIVCRVLALPRLELCYEDLIADPTATTRRVGEFMGVDLSGWRPAAPKLQRQSNELNRQFRDAFIADFRKKFGL